MCKKKIYCKKIIKFQKKYFFKFVLKFNICYNYSLIFISRATAYGKYFRKT